LQSEKKAEHEPDVYEGVLIVGTDRKMAITFMPIGFAFFAYPTNPIAKGLPSSLK
jgi:hypothetical protein